MTDNEIRIAIAEKCGRNGWWCPQCKKLVSEYSLGYQNRHANCSESAREAPDYPNDLNAVHEVVQQECRKNPLFLIAYHDAVMSVAKTEYPLEATARQRCEALLRTWGLWKE